MNLSTYIKLITKKKGTIFSILILFIIIVAIFILTQTWKYEDRASLLVTQNFSVGVDPYQASRANDYLSGVLAKIVKSNSFFTEVLNAGFNINRNYFPVEANKQLKTWQKTIYAKHISGTSMIQISVFHQDRYQADQILRAALEVLQTKHNLYHSGGGKVNLRIIDQPIISDNPVKPNITLDFSLAIIIGLIFSLSYIYVLPDEKYNLRFWPKQKQKKIKIRIPKKKTIDKKEENDVIKEVLNRLRKKNYAPANPIAPNIVKNNNNYNKQTSRENILLRKKPTETQMPNYNSNSFASDKDDLEYESIIKEGSIDNIIRS